MLTTVTSLDIGTAVAVAAVFCVAYTVLGGLLADALTDLVQGVVLIFGLFLLLAAVMADQGGIAATFAAIDTARVSIVAPGVTPTFFGMLEEYAIPIAGSVVAVELLSRVIAARSPEVARNSAVLAGGMYVVVGLVPVLLGLVAARLVPNLADAEQFLPALALQVLPTAGYIIFMGALISAILSTVDTILLVAGGLLAHNVVGPALHITDDRMKLRLARGGVVLFGAVALYLALGGRGVAELVQESSSFGTAGTLVVVSFGLFTRYGGPRAAGVTLLGGLAIYAGGTAIGVPYPFITSLAGAMVLYVAGGFRERR